MGKKKNYKQYQKPYLTMRIPYMTYSGRMQSKSEPVFCCSHQSVTFLFSSKSRANIGGKALFYAEVRLQQKVCQTCNVLIIGPMA